MTHIRFKPTGLCLIVLIATLSFQLSTAGANPIEKWAATFNGPINDNDYARDIVVDEQGNGYV